MYIQMEIKGDKNVRSIYQLKIDSSPITNEEKTIISIANSR